MISKRSHSTGAAGGNGMSQVSEEEIKRSFDEAEIKDTPKARKQKARLGRFFKEYWDCFECRCGR